ncbi:Rab-GTPase-TBC [Gracilaria domingensis]|nr:Rab-GTPase-TBC [Gracilaria domingensis]
MADENATVFGVSDGLLPGRVVRVGKPVDWTSILKATQERERRYKERSTAANASSSNSGVNSSQSSLISKRKSSTAQPFVEEDSHPVQTEPQNVKQESTRSVSSSSSSSVSSSEKLKQLLAEPTMNIEAVRKLAWAGLVNDMRAPIWKALLGYVPTNLSRRKDTLRRKRREYQEAVSQHYDPLLHPREHPTVPNSNTYNRAGNQEDVTMRQISVDIPRTCPGQALFHVPEVQQALKRILYVWATRHPASGYVQGMNDLVTPFLYVFLSEYAKGATDTVLLQVSDLSGLDDPEEALANAEADSYWCLTALLNDIQDYYTFSQPGIQRRVHFLRELVARVDGSLCSHLEDEGLDFLQFAFRWMNCLLMRELPFPLIVRVWDTYLAETDGFATFHVYVCAALLVSFSEDLQDMDFQDLVMFLQNLPTESWTSREIDVILSQAYMWRTIFGAAPRHLQ